MVAFVSEMLVGCKAKPVPTRFTRGCLSVILSAAKDQRGAISCFAREAEVPGDIVY